MCVCVVFVVSYFILYYFCFYHLSIFWIFQIFQTFYLKSSDLSMVNPHISLNPWNPPIHGAILRFSEDFYCEIHRFHGAILRFSTEDLFQLNPQVDLRSSSSLSGCQCDVVDRLPFTQSLFVPLIHCRWCFWELDLSGTTDLSTDGFGAVCLCWIISFDFLLYSSHHEILTVWGEILRFSSKSLGKSSDCAWILLNPWIYQIYLSIFKFSLISIFKFILSIQSITITILNHKSSVFGFYAKARKLNG